MCDILARTTHDMDVMMKKQNRLIGKLRDECKRQAAQIEKLVKKNRSVSLCIYMFSYHIGELFLILVKKNHVNERKTSF